MKTLLALILITFISYDVLAQATELNQTITKRYSNQFPSIVLSDLAKLAGLTVEKNGNSLPVKANTYTFDEVTIEDAITNLLTEFGLYFRIRNNILLIYDEPTEKNFYTIVTKRNFSISGKVIDGENSEALAYASIGLKGTTKGVTTNADGFFTMLNVPSDTLTLSIHYIGYSTREIPIKDIIDSDPLIIELSLSNLSLDEVVVTGSNLDNQMMSATESISTLNISPQALQSLPSMGEKDIFRNIQLLPGVSGTNEASSGLFVRGGTPDQNLVVLDGFTVYHVDHFYGFFSAFNPNAIKNVQLHKGGFGAKYGGRLSSVMELTGKTGNQNNLSGGFGFGAISANAYLEIPIQKNLNLFLAGRRSYTDILKSGIYNDIFDLYNTDDSSPSNTSGLPTPRRGPQQEDVEPAFFFYDANAKLNYRPSSRDVISLSYYSGKDDLDNSRVSFNSFQSGEDQTIGLNNDIEDLVQWGNIGTSFRWARIWNDRIYSTFITSYSNYFSDRDRISDVTIERDDTTSNRRLGTLELNDLHDFSISFDTEYLVNEAHKLELGFKAVINDISYSLTANDTLNLISEKNDGVLASLYLQDTWTVASNIELNGGVRASYYDVLDKFYYEPRLQASYSITPNLKIKAAWGNYHQFVNRIVREDVSQGSRDFWLLADGNNSPVSFSRHLIAGVSYETSGWLFDVEFYDKSLDGIVEYSNRQAVTSLSELDDANYFFQGDGVARGVEWLVQKKTGRYKGWLSYTLGEVVQNIPGISDDPFYALHDTRHEINLVNTYEIGQWNFGATWVYGTGKPYTAPYGEYNITTLDGTDYNFISVGAKNAFQLPDYHRLDLSANYGFPLGDSASGQLGLSIFNVYNRNNTWYKEFLVEEGDVIETDVNLIGFTPNLTLSIKF